jgi:hypothetical protein
MALDMIVKEIETLAHEKVLKKNLASKFEYS